MTTTTSTTSTTSTTRKKHRASTPTAATARTDLSGGAHRSSRNAETFVVVALGAALIVLAMVMTLRG
jgi:hypothetical protein